jgi:hypothetical protein
MLRPWLISRSIATKCMALALKLAADLAVERLLIGFHGQEEVGPLLLELPRTDAGYGAHPPG